MDVSIIAIFIAISVIVSIVQRIGEARKARERKHEPRAPGLSPEAQKLPESTRRVLFGPSGGLEDAPARQRQEREPPPVPTVRDIFKAVTGIQTEDDEEWKPLVEPPPRRELPRQIQQAQPRQELPRQIQQAQPRQESPRQIQQAPPRQAQQERPAQRGVASRQTPQRRVQRPGAKVAVQQRPAQAVSRSQQRPARPQTRPAARGAATGRGRLFEGLDDIRRGLIMKEILGTPRGLENF